MLMVEKNVSNITILNRKYYSALQYANTVFFFHQYGRIGISALRERQCSISLKRNTTLLEHFCVSFLNWKMPTDIKLKYYILYKYKKHSLTHFGQLYSYKHTLRLLRGSWRRQLMSICLYYYPFICSGLRTDGILCARRVGWFLKFPKE